MFSVFLFGAFCIVAVSVRAQDVDPLIDWNIRVQILDDPRHLFAQLFDDGADLRVELLASFAGWAESPHYVDSLESILFSSPTDRTLYRYHLPTKATSVFIADAGEFGARGTYDRDIPLDQLREGGSNGITGHDGDVILCQHALGRVIAFDPLDLDAPVTVLADNYHGNELNSPNDVSVTRDGKSLFFTDPPFGLQREGDAGFLDSFARSPLGFSGVYKVDLENPESGAELVVFDLLGPNGVAVNKNGRQLIVSHTGASDGFAPFWNVYERRRHSDAYQWKRTIEYSMRDFPFNGFAVDVPLVDGMELFDDDILLATGPNGVYVMDLKRYAMVGRIVIDHLLSNVHVHDGWLYITGADHLFRIKLKSKSSKLKPKPKPKPKKSARN